MQAKVLMTLLLSVLATPVVAGEMIESMFIGPNLLVAQMAPEELRLLRQHWEQASPEERMSMRRQLQERIRQFTPDELAVRRRQLEEHRGGINSEPHPHEQRDPWGAWIPNPANPAGIAGTAENFISNFGTGFEQRHPGQAIPDDNAPNPDPHDRFDPNAGRSRR